MAVIAIILLTIVLVAQIVLFILYFLEKRYVNHRFSAMLQYADRRLEECDCEEAVMDSVNDVLDAFYEKISEGSKMQNDAIIEFKNSVNARLCSLELDYTQAQEAANKVNDFASGLSSIFDYDPMETIRRNRNKEDC